MWIGIARVEPVHQFSNVAREIINIAVHMTAQRHHGALIASRRAPQAQINPSRIERIQRTELLGDNQR